MRNVRSRTLEAKSSGVEEEKEKERQRVAGEMEVSRRRWGRRKGKGRKGKERKDEKRTEKKARESCQNNQVSSIDHRLKCVCSGQWLSPFLHRDTSHPLAAVCVQL